MVSIAANVEAAVPKNVAQAAPPPPPADPVDVCVREFHEMGSRAFQAKYLNNSLNRKFYEAAIDRGICGQWFCAIHAEDEAWRYCVLELGDEGGEG